MMRGLRIPVKPKHPACRRGRENHREDFCRPPADDAGRRQTDRERRAKLLAELRRGGDCAKCYCSVCAGRETCTAHWTDTDLEETTSQPTSGRTRTAKLPGPCRGCKIGRRFAPTDRVSCPRYSPNQTAAHEDRP